MGVATTARPRRGGPERGLGSTDWAGHGTVLEAPLAVPARLDMGACGQEALRRNPSPPIPFPLCPPRQPGAAYNASRRSWSFPLAGHDEVVKALEGAQGVRVRVEPLPTVALTVLQVTLKGVVGRRLCAGM